ncbi:MAG: ComF family protein [Candidatus Dormibacteraeota bacterium]|uniref:ComF family protein n=1 Tax=Candidatus Aeolococcus gillhamiae TaxID=3127015 RepID=A0A934MYD5_9BACT|nr:ComF family protein [Candidatus Dormibacteraeota bacterium]
MYEWLSRGCTAVLDCLAPARCAGCGDAGHVLCEACTAFLEAFPTPLIAGARAAFVYDDEVRLILHHGKFRDCRTALRALSWLGASRLTPPVGALVVPVPLSGRRLAERGYNQARVVAAAFADFHRLPIADLLERARETPPQSTLDRAARQGSVAGAFAANADVDGKRLWVVDDVLTTGATSNAAKSALLDAGAAHVEVAVLAAVL